ncbi:ATP-dependent helicase [Thermodesulfobacteriota bacterium]
MIELNGERLGSHMSNGHIDYEGELNPRQLEAVTAGEGPVLVIAGAGSGKTRTIVYRVAWLVNQGVDPSSILLLTFTRRAAEEMLTRAGELLDTRVSQVAGGTFHSTGNLLLRRYGNLLGFDSSFSIMDQGDSFDAIDHIKKELILPPEKTKGFPKARTIAAVLSFATGTGGDVQDSLERRYPHLVSFTPEVEQIGKQYTEHKKVNNLMDYDDLLLNTIRLLEENDHVRDHVADRWRYILVDEYQDTNRLQARMLRLLASGHDNVMAVGDDSQSIYSFRGADFQNILTFPDLFTDTKIIKLEENYRSTQPILTVTNSIIERAASGYPKRLFTRKKEGPLPMAVRPKSERDQSSFVIDCLKELQSADIPMREVAVLFRAGFHSFDLEGELTRRGYSFVKYGGFKFLESLHIKDSLAHLKAATNPKDRLSWARTLKLLPGIGVKTAIRLTKRIAEEGIPDDAGALAKKRQKFYEPLKELLALAREIGSPGPTLSEKMERINAYYYPYLKEAHDNYPKRMRDLDRLTDLTLSYKSANQFLNEMALDPPGDDKLGDESTSDSLVLSTIHSAKGLEWHTVIVIWAAEGSIPSPMAAESPDELEEERRLIYVATTRAKRNLIISAPRSSMHRRLGYMSVEPSRFFAEIPPEYFRTYRY